MNKTMEEWLAGMATEPFVLGRFVADVLEELVALRKRVAQLEGVNYPGEISGR